MSVARICVSLLVSFTYPLQCNPARRCVMTLLADVCQDHNRDPVTLPRILMFRHLMVTVSYCIHSISNPLLLTV